MRGLRAQTRAEIVMTLRRGESVLLTLAIPVGLLIFFSLVHVLPDQKTTAAAVTFLAPGILALAVMSTAMVSLGIATGFERQYGVLKRLGSTPLGRPALLTAKTAAIGVIEVLQVVVLAGVALLLGWHPHGNPGLAVVAIFLATVGFAGLGLLMAGALRAEVTLAAANGLYLVLLLLGGMVFSLNQLPSALRTVSPRPAGGRPVRRHARGADHRRRGPGPGVDRPRRVGRAGAGSRHADVPLGMTAPSPPVPRGRGPARVPSAGGRRQEVVVGSRRGRIGLALLAACCLAAGCGSTRTPAAQPATTGSAPTVATTGATTPPRSTRPSSGPCSSPPRISPPASPRRPPRRRRR